MAQVIKGTTYSNGDEVTATNLNNHVDNATVTNIQTADIADGQITSAKIASSTIVPGDVDLTQTYTWTVANTTGDATVYDCDSLTTGSIMELRSNSTDSSERQLLLVKNSNASATTAAGIYVDQNANARGIVSDCAGTNVCVQCQNSGDGPHLRLTGDPTVASPADGDIWYTGSALNFYNGSTTTDLLSASAGTQQFNAKAWGYVTYSGGTPTLQDSYNISGITDTAQGRLNVQFDTDFANVNYAIMATAEDASSDDSFCTVNTKAVGACEIAVRRPGTGLVDPDGIMFVAFGDQ